MIAAAVAASSAFVVHAIIWNIIALPCDPVAYPNHTIYFPEECVFHSWYRICYGLPMYIEVAAASPSSASVWAVVALAISVWVPDKLLTVRHPFVSVSSMEYGCSVLFYRSYVTSSSYSI